MKKIFVYDGIADKPLYGDGYRAVASGYVEGAKLMFAAEDIGGFVYTTAYADESTVNDRIYGTLWEVDEESYDWLVGDLYGDLAVSKGLTFVSSDGEKDKADTCYLAGGVFAVPSENRVRALERYYEYYDLDTAYIRKAVDDCECEVSGGARA